VFSLNNLNPQVLLAKLAVVLVVVIGVYFYGHHTGYEVAQSANRAAMIEAQAQAEKQYKALEAKQNAQAADLQKQLDDARNNVQVREKIVKQFIDRPVYKNQCFDQQGLNELNDFIKHKGGHQ